MNEGRLTRLQQRMRDQGVDHAIFSVGPDLDYLVGYSAMISERITALSVPAEGDAVLFVPRLEAPRVPRDSVEVVAWDEWDDPIAMLAARCRDAGRLAIGDHMWSVFLIRLMGHIDAGRLIPGSELTRHLRAVKDDLELDALRRAARAVDRVLGRIPTEVGFGGRTESDVAEDIRRMVLEEGHDAVGFAIVAGGPNSASPHHEPGARVIGDGEAVVCDFGGSVDGYFSDVTRTFCVGEPPSGLAEVHAVVKAANQDATATIGPGVPCQEVDRTARGVIKEAGYGEFFVHRTGHGIGLEVHEHPYMVEGNEEALAPGMTFSVEPGVYLPDRFGVRIEDIVVCTLTGSEVLNHASRELVSVA